MSQTCNSPWAIETAIEDTVIYPWERRWFSAIDICLNQKITLNVALYVESATIRIMNATVRHVSSGSGLTKFYAAWFLLNRVYLFIVQLLEYLSQYMSKFRPNTALLIWISWFKTSTLKMVPLPDAWLKILIWVSTPSLLLSPLPFLSVCSKRNQTEFYMFHMTCFN